MNPPPKPHPLVGNQLKAVNPDDTVWLSASAGTGKTEVLSSRVLRLLLQPGVKPSQILCLTFTKAGATEMAQRINGRLARWVRMDDPALAGELQAIGADIGEQTRNHARTLFAQVLDCPGGGLRIDTIHAFAQWLLAAFPLEAGLAPGTRAMEDRDRALLQRQVLADLLVEAENTPLGDPQLMDAITALSLALGPEGVESWLLRAAGEHRAWFGPGGFQEPMREPVLRLLGLSAETDESDLAQLCSDAVFDVDALELCLSAYRQWDTKTGNAAVEAISAWLAMSPQDRLEGLDPLFKLLFSQEHEVKNRKNVVKFEEHFEEAGKQVLAAMLTVRDLRSLLALADRLTKAFRLARAFAHAWEEAKAREGLIDFDDQIRIAADLLTDSDLAQWIGYKLDRQIDHILVDEAQDTNAAQWRIILDGLAQEFFSGAGQRGDALRTLFVVGDYKQAIFRFQGTSPEEFRKASDRVRAAMEGAAQNAENARANAEPRKLKELGLDRSFRTGQPVLDFVNRAITALGYARFGLDKPADTHAGDKRKGLVTLWQPVGETTATADSDDGEGEEAQQSWLSKPERQLADKIARQVKAWIDGRFPLYKGRKPGEEPRAATAGDVMVLLRKRGALASLIVARLHEHGVPVAGVDRLRLGAPLAVKDLMAALRFAAQPLDDLNLAALLVSSLIGWSQEQLLEHGYRPRHARLWEHLRRSSHAEVALAMERLTALLARADFDPPQTLLHWLLVGPWQARKALVARLGAEANDPIDELLNAAHGHAMASVPSLAGFIAWFDAGDGELKREADSTTGLVRVMTVHGAKGLQAPIVILADATANPEKMGRGEMITLTDPASTIGQGEPRSLPIPGLRKADHVGVIATAAERQAREQDEEHWRLLYVAMTRAEEALFVGGALLSSEDAPAEASWYAELRKLFSEEDRRGDAIWDARFDAGDWPDAQGTPVAEIQPQAATTRPDWLDRPAGAEPRPPRPLAPSSLGEDIAGDPPYPPGTGAAAARRGVLIHSLLERLPDLPESARAEAATRWLARHGSDLEAAAQAEIIDRAMAVLAEPEWAELFGPDALAEAPIAATVGGVVVAGTIDRLLIGPDRIQLIDFKSARRPPDALAQVPRAVLRQMAAYSAALEAAFPGRRVEAALLYTQTPHLIPLPADVLAPFKLELQGAQ